MQKKLISILNLKKLVKRLKKENKKIVFTNGCFDIIHLGHLRYLKKAKDLGDVLIVGLNSDSSVKKIKGAERPFFSERNRAEFLSYLPFVDFIVIFKEKTPEKLIKEISPHFQVKGGDYKLKDIKEKEVVEKLGGKVILLPLEKGYSTTNIIKKILNLSSHKHTNKKVW
jgi:rfaE bifunctional protein nucleotidyltransferase chain/domain